MTAREKEILELIRKNPLISQQECADALGITRSAAAGHIMNLSRQGYIKGKGYILQESPYVVVIGGANIDIQGFPFSPLIMHDSNPGLIKLSCGGVGRNIAENLARLGCDVRLISILGDDAFAHQLRTETEAAGVDISNCITVHNDTTSTYLSILNTSGDMEIALASMEILNKLTVSSIKTKADVIRNAAAVVLDTNLNEEVISYILTTFPDTVFFADPVSVTKAHKLVQNLGNLYCIKPNILEAEVLTGKKLSTVEEIEQAGHDLLSRGVQQVVISRGEDGLYCCNEDESFFRPAPQVHIKNCTGAGDAFMAGLVYSWLHGMTLQEAAAFAEGASKMTLEHENTINPTLSVENILKTIK
ncbi:MAG: bifunctional hydroxymethylpyrimidine kinase/phosphomethylpyrimidine kinase [Treponema sp.]|nr:bifunctional hydroxymethylpyrimidine kinase/phosphomethylpyrimidine kinase [Treponema sp.]